MSTITYDELRANAELLRGFQPSTSKPFRIVEQAPVKTFSNSWRQSKSKVGRRWVKVKEFSGWAHIVEEGQPLLSKEHHMIIMHPADAQRLRQMTLPDGRRPTILGQEIQF